MVMVGAGQALFQIYIWLANGYWSSFTNEDLLAEFGMSLAYLQLGVFDIVLELVLDREFSLTLVLLGASASLLSPLLRLYDKRHAERVIAARKSLATHR